MKTAKAHEVVTPIKIELISMTPEDFRKKMKQELRDEVIVKVMLVNLLTEANVILNSYCGEVPDVKSLVERVDRVIELYHLANQ